MEGGSSLVSDKTISVSDEKYADILIKSHFWANDQALAASRLGGFLAAGTIASAKLWVTNTAGEPISRVIAIAIAVLILSILCSILCHVIMSFNFHESIRKRNKNGITRLDYYIRIVVGVMVVQGLLLISGIGMIGYHYVGSLDSTQPNYVDESSVNSPPDSIEQPKK